jgi:hypothetical protein
MPLSGNMYTPDASHRSYQRKSFDTGKSAAVRPRFLSELQTENYAPFGIGLVALFARRRIPLPPNEK